MESLPFYLRIEPDADIPDLSQLAPFKVMVILEAGSSTEWREILSERLVAAGCRYMMAWGKECEEFHDIVDTTSLERHNYDVPDDAFIMTTWHADESLKDLFWYCQFFAECSADEVELRDALLIHVALIDREAEYRELYAQSETLAEREDDEGSV